jgi:hypothetical protein
MSGINAVPDGHWLVIPEKGGLAAWPDERRYHLGDNAGERTGHPAGPAQMFQLIVT